MAHSSLGGGLGYVMGLGIFDGSEAGRSCNRKERGPILAVEYDWGVIAAYTYRLVKHLSGARGERVPPGAAKKDVIGDGDGDVGCCQSLPSRSIKSALGMAELCGVASFAQMITNTTSFWQMPFAVLRILQMD